MHRVVSAIAVVVCASTVILAPGGGAAAAWPEKEIKLVVPYPAGGPADLLARAIGERLTAKYGKTVIVENKGGAGGNIGSDAVAKAAPDGYTLVLGTNSTHATNASLYEKMPYDTVKDFAPITLVATVPNVLVVNPKVPAQTLDEFIVAARAKAGGFNYASTGIGSAAHLTAELFKMQTGIEMVHVPYPGAAPAMTDLLGGRTDVMFATLPSILAQVKAKKLRALAVTSSFSSPELPGVLAVSESLPGFLSNAWFALFAPAGTPKAIVDKLSADVGAILDESSTAAKLKKAGFTPISGTPEELASFVADEMLKWGRVVKSSGAKAE